MQSSPTVAAAILSSRETPDVLLAAIDAARCALAPLGGVLDVVINGNRALAEAVSAKVSTTDDARSEQVRTRFWYVALGDKAHAWNTYVHHLWPDARTTVFIDGYVEVAPQALGLIDRTLTDSPAVSAATGVPSVGSSASRLRREMIEGGGIHGNLCALSRAAMVTIRQSGFRLPLGLYRVDSLLGSAICFRFDSVANRWDPGQIRVVPEASWAFRSLKWWHPGDIVKHFRRVLRQDQGRLENNAFRSHFRDRKLSLSELPRTALEMVEHWVATRPDEVAGLMKSRLLVRRALKRMRVPRDWSQSLEPPLCVFDSNDGRRDQTTG
ncbi:hypothetical protein J5J83_20800 [Azoarcus sp. L1K30]|uniref:hypothetical protein n=1 Tax=Azoarcus sp. L1K30 TaxID=2820277 RepID=UPI001B83202C|nr:hypothetical protein [Azoarcus sp. L1K30]MBR0568571.1 hypothetical protein [Azoarcus sp. L1K30]